MHTSGHRAEFRGEGTLVIDGTVAVRKTSAGRVEVEKVGSDVAMMMRQRNSFAEVMRVVYDNLAVVAGV
jgi:cleavage and polyadenylation specificity factor subunit 2